MTSNGMSPESVEATLFREKLWKEEPKMDAAIKSYCSWLVAQQHQTLIVQQQQQLDEGEDSVQVTTHIQQQHAWEMTEVLGLARKLSKSINAYVFDIRPDESTERSIVAQVWNEVAAMSTINNSKPTSAGVRITKMLGQTALIYAWKELDRSDLLPANYNKVHVQVKDAQQQQQKQEQEQHETARLFLDTFERFLFANNTTTTTGEAATATAAADSSLSTCCSSSSSSSSSTLFNDAQLFWSPDGGKQELYRRATQRQKVALERRQEEEEESSQRLRDLLQLEQQQQQQQTTSGSSSSATVATAFTPTITIIEEGTEEKEN